MRHVTDAVLRRLVDEPLTVADTTLAHVGSCDRCSARSTRISADAATAAALGAHPAVRPDVDAAWRRFERGALDKAGGAARRRGHRAPAPRRWRLAVLPVPSGLALGALALVIAGAAAATTLTVVFAPTHVKPLPIATSDVSAIADVAGVGGSGILGGLPTPSGSQKVGFGTLTWSSSGRPQTVASIAAAERATGLHLRVPARLPAGVQSPTRVVVQPEVRATIRFNALAAPALAGSSLTIDAGPAALIEFGGESLEGFPTLGTFAMARPAIYSSSMSTAQLEAFVLSRPGIPPGLAQEIRLLGDLHTTLPVPVPKGADVSQVDVGGAPGVLVGAPSGVASGVIWEDHGGVVHAAFGLLDPKDVLDVAEQLG
ncbi:MAG: hypothetical protein ACRDZ5_05380 [Acidimicrobiales bacterium]